MLPSIVVVISFFICLMVPLSLARYGEECRTPKDEQGKCVPIMSCTSASEIIQNILTYGEDRFADKISYLVDSGCGWFENTPIVCCEKENITINPTVYNHLKEQKCGISAGSSRIAGALDNADLYQFRWMALLKYKSASGKDQFLCGGSLIDDRHVLTAAHCLYNSTNLPVAVRLGEYNLMNETDCFYYGPRKLCLDPVQDIPIKNYFPHEDYVYLSEKHDIAILRLERPVNLKTKSITPICLPISEELRSNIPDHYLAAGWGMTQYGKRSDVLLWTSIPHKPHKHCEETYSHKNLKLSDAHICAGGHDFRETCKGDSGGPIFNTRKYVDGGARSVQYGIVSLGAMKCGEGDYPAVYTNVPYYMQWITDHIVIEEEEEPNVVELPTTESYFSISSVSSIENSVSRLKTESAISVVLVFISLLRAVAISAFS